MSFVVVTVVILYLGFYLVSTIINTETYLFDNAFAQQQTLSNITNSDNSFMIANYNTLSSGNSSDNSPEEDLIKLYDKVDQSVVQVTQDSNVLVHLA